MFSQNEQDGGDILCPSTGVQEQVMVSLGPDRLPEPVPVRCAVFPEAASRESSVRLFELQGGLAG